MSTPVTNRTLFRLGLLVLSVAAGLWISSQWSTILADGGSDTIVFGDLEADPVTSTNEISFYWEASTSDGVELRPTFVLQEGDDPPKLAEVAAYSSEEQNPMPMIESGSYYSWTMVVGLIPCTEHRLWVANLPKELMDAVMTHFTDAHWAQMTERSKPLRFWTRSADGSGCDLNPSRQTSKPQIEQLVWTNQQKPMKRRAEVEWRNPGGVEPVVMVKRLGEDEGPEQLASLRGTMNPMVPGAVSAMIRGLEPCSTYRVRVYERHPNFGSVDEPLRVFRGNQDRKSNGVVIRTAGCND